MRMAMVFLGFRALAVIGLYDGTSLRREVSLRTDQITLIGTCEGEAQAERPVRLNGEGLVVVGGVRVFLVVVWVLHTSFAPCNLAFVRQVVVLQRQPRNWHSYGARPPTAWYQSMLYA